MNKNIKLAVAGAVLALSATAANAGIVIPAGEWTLDVNGNVNTFASWTKYSGSATQVVGGLGGLRQAGEDRTQSINTGLLPAWLGFTGTTRQNDVDVSFTISMQPNVSDQGGAVHGDSSTPLNRQAFMTFGDKSWGSFKLGKDIGIFASDAILNDMTLLGVGGGSANSGTATTLGGIGSGYIYAGWKGQVAYSTPNFNGFQATVGIVNPNQIAGDEEQTVARTAYQDRFGFEGKASYSFAANDVTGKVWVSGAHYDVTYNQTTRASYKAQVADIGATVNVAGFGLTGYYYSGEGAGTTLFGNKGAGTAGQKRDSDGGYIQATYVLPTKTKVGLAYGISSLDQYASEGATTLVKDNERYTVGLYHPLTKHLNLVAEYNDMEAKAHNGIENKSRTGSLGAILFF
jgi:predicted porin